MSVLNLFARARQQEVARTSNLNNLVFRVTAYSAAGALVACAAWQSAGYAYILGVARSETKRTCSLLVPLQRQSWRRSP